MTTLTRRRWWWLLWCLVAVSALGIALYSVEPYLVGDLERNRIPLNPEVAAHYLSIAAHAIPSSLALLIGPFQFVTRIRVRYPKLHRNLGRVYLGSVVLGSITALFAATFSVSGFSVQVAFYIMTAAWLYTLVQAYRTIRQGQVQLHRIWMIRNYALTFAAVSLRIYLIIGLMLQESFLPGLTFDDVYHAAAWAALLVNVMVAEYFIIHRTLKPLARRQQVIRPPDGRVPASAGSS
ncbi:DUF2306 domain-containing protein [Natronosporangium hydrolyticum]|uniref:DUF2306 domain-containing protein n=1 Tax=Natronosporangium hydrolyticum TaxID=2811111 RepID=A0A895Y923_9ACTN|nr:DUF2306 domain-containing protein [Natronosporangium hydrolyticum]QSB12815.1 DUF2306 domain-containing protein [Natronosporangium hydrolyticum]